MTFCTGGIRCVKVNAYLEQRLGFCNTMRLHDGIHGYERYVAQQGATSLWEGHNFLFDKRQHLGITAGEFAPLDGDVTGDDVTGDEGEVAASAEQDEGR
mmetsp:Transcript_50233/g.139143  ORF Transcript_50233/g.139143 Transcript_50233/m.139143 type:complete len:99 (+) Transcript_50233:1-297(+)